jgi:hypothetical protein
LGEITEPADAQKQRLRGMKTMKKYAVLLFALVIACGSCEPGKRGAGENAILSHEKLLAILSGQFKRKQPSPEVISEVIHTLDVLLSDRDDTQAGTRRLACDVLGRSKSREAIPVLLKALEDPYEWVDFRSMGPDRPAHMEWFAVWRDADEGLRQITGANPIPEPRQRSPIPGQRESVREAWLKWWSDNSGQQLEAEAAKGAS